jgi:hypothetical protein
MNQSKSLSGSSLAGSSSTRERVNNDYYATPPESTKALLAEVDFTGEVFMEPCVGAGHIADVIKEYYVNAKVIGCDIVDRGYPNTNVLDFLKTKFNFKIDNIITNPPYSLAQEFLEKSIEITKEGGKIAMFLKIQFLEGQKRKDMFKRYPPKHVYVFTKRQNPWRNGSPVDENGKPWSSTMCFAWFVWEVGFKGDPVIKWI